MQVADHEGSLLCKSLIMRGFPACFFEILSAVATGLKNLQKSSKIKIKNNLEGSQPKKVPSDETVFFFFFFFFALG